MNVFFIVLAALVAGVLHELTHLAVLKAYGGRVTAVFLTRVSFGFTIDPGPFIEDDRRLALLLLAPYAWCAAVLVDPSSWPWIMFLLVNGLGGLADVHVLRKLLRMDTPARIEFIRLMDMKLEERSVFIKAFS